MKQFYKKTSILILCLCCLIINSKMLAQGGNDPCSATAVSSGGCTAGTTVGQTYSNNAANGGTPSCAVPGAPDVWFSFTPGATNTYSIFTTAGSMTDSGMSLYSASTCSTGFTQLACDDEGGAGSMSAIIQSLTAGTTYYIRVWRYSSGTGTFNLCITPTTVNDDCSGAISLTPGAACINGTNVGSTTPETTGPWPSCWASLPSNSVWYKFVADDDSMTVDLGSGTLGATTEAGVYSGSCGALTQVAPNVSSCTENSTQMVMTGLVPGNTYYIMVDAQGTNVGTFCITVFDTPPKPPTPGSSCSNPRTLYPWTSCTAVTGAQYDNHDNQLGSAGDTPGSTASSTFSLTGASPDPTCTTNDNTQKAYWADFVATSTTTTFNDNDALASPPAVCATAQDYAVYTGSCGSLTEVDCFSLGGSCGIGCCNPTTRNVTTVIGTHYYVLITPSGATSPGTDIRFLCITSTTPSTPGGGVASNTCSSAPSINANTTYTINNANADITGTEPPLCVGSSENTIFVNWTVPAGWTNPTYVHMYNQDCNSSLGMQLSVFAAGTTCSSASPSCLVATNPGNNNDFTGAFTAVAGNTYLIALDGNAGAGCEFNFLIDHQVTLPIELLNFDATEKNGIVELAWSTASEINSNTFTLEKSKDGIDFDKINDYIAAGNSTSIKNYKGYDFSPYSDITYYRLKQTDYSGDFKYSNIINISLSEKNEHIGNLYPNPTEGFASFQFHAKSKGEVFTQVYDCTGSIFLENIHTVELGENQININTSKLDKGIYILKITIKSSDKTVIQRIIKN